MRLFLDEGDCIFLMARILDGEILMPAADTENPKNSISWNPILVLLGFSRRLFALRVRKVVSRCST